MATRYHATTYSIGTGGKSQPLTPIEWYVEIYDPSFVGSSTEFHFSTPCINITHEGDGSTLFEPNSVIRTSRASVYISVNDGTLASFLKSISGGQETGCTIKIYKGGTTMADLVWIGTVLPDMISWPEISYPYTYTLQGIDGLGRLDNFEFTYASNSANPEKVEFHKMIAEALKLTGLYSFFTASDTFIRFSENWYELNQSTAKSTLAGVRGKRLNLLKNWNPQQPDQLEAMTCKEVIEAILTPFGAKIEFSRGSYRVFSVTNSVSSSITEYKYAYDGTTLTYLSSAAINPRVTIATNGAGPPMIVSGANWTYRKPVLNARIYTPNTISVAVYKSYSLTALNQNCGNFDGSLTTRDMLLKGKMVIETFGYTTGRILWTITVGSGGSQVWLKRENNGTLTWTNVAWTLDTFIPNEQAYGTKATKQVYFELMIPALTTPNTGDIVIEASYQGLIYGISKGKTFYTGGFFNGSFSLDLQLIQTTGIDTGIWTGIDYANAENTDTPNNSITQEIETRWADGTKFRQQALEIWNGAAWEYSDSWDIGTPSGGGTPLNELFAQTVAGYQKYGYGQKVLQGDVIGDIDNVSALVYNSEVFMFVSGTYNVKNDTMSGEWILLSYDNTGLNTTTGTKNPDVTKEELHDRKLEDIGGMVNQLMVKQGELHLNMVDSIIHWAKSGAPTSAPAVPTNYAVQLTYDVNGDGDNQFQFKLSSVAAGTVSSVALAAPSELSVSGSPVTSSGTLTLAWANQTTNKVFISPNGSTGTPTFRALAHADLAASGGSGTKYLRDDMTWQTVSGGSGVTTMAAIGAVPNANGASISGTTLTLQPADATYGGVLTNTTQDIAGSKRFTHATTRFTSASAKVDLYGVSNFNGGFQIYAEWAIRRTPTSGGQANCIAIGTAMNTTFTGYYNIAIGDNSMAALTTGIRNCSIGLAAMQSLTTGTDNMAIGKDAMKLITTGYSNVGVGSNALYLQSTRNNNTAIGESAGYAVDGNKNVHIGAYTAYDSGAGTLRAQNNNVIIGYQAGFQNRGDGNIYIGYQAGYSETTNSNLLMISNEYNDFLIKGSLVATKWVDINGQLRLKDVATNTNTPSGATAKQIKIYDQTGTAYYVPGYADAW